MQYTKAPYSLTYAVEETILHSQKGIFIVDNDSMIRLLRILDGVSFTDDKKLNDLWETHGSRDFSIEDVILYLTEETMILIELRQGFAVPEPCFVTSGSMPLTIVTALFDRSSIIDKGNLLDRINSDVNKIYFIDYINESTTEGIEKILNAINPNCVVIFLFQIADHFVISHSYTKKILQPCILCLHDYINERVFSDHNSKNNSFSSVIDYINSNYNIPCPLAKTDELDFYYLMRELKQYILTLTGDGRCAFTGCDVNKSRIFNIHSLRKSDITVPFSPRCNCMYNYHLNKGYLDA
ncbi:hypothetical protein [Type-D symbiont of Plautia stali]|uniref:hypothetical protein n=1 Tax=Type-D symbiont of Plautia stali TaxID=1560356 RepID=UPI00073F749F|nr:hypothetical protein [Type-D symbiont of Plautia stali]